VYRDLIGLNSNAKGQSLAIADLIVHDNTASSQWCGRRESNMTRIAILTSGGDAPGMNAAIRAATRCALNEGWEVFGAHHGYAGLLKGDFEALTARSVGGIIQRGGTILGTSREPAFYSESSRQQGLEMLQRQRIDHLIVIGGNGSQAGAYALSQMEFPVVGVSSTIDNDLAECDVTLGVDTALNIALEAIDRLKTTASSHQRAFLVEVMGRKCGYLALMAGITGGAEAILIPEVEIIPEQVAEQFHRAYTQGKSHALGVVAEGAMFNATQLEAYFTAHHEELGFDLRTTILGHVQRGGEPTAYDRFLGTRLGAEAVNALARGEYGVLCGLFHGKIATLPFEKVVGVPKTIDPTLLALANVLNI
jgi:6-phosphofructokinase 1